jgi:hypothetical protein
LTDDDETSAQTKYAAFLLVLKVWLFLFHFEQNSYTRPQQTTDLTLPTYIELLKAAGKIRRPFQAQAFALTNLCCELADQFGKAEKKPLLSVENIGDLQA